MTYTKLMNKRKSKGFTQKYMSAQLGYKDKSSYCLIENGKVRITSGIALKIKQILELTDKEFMDIFFTSNVEVCQTKKEVV